VGAKDNDENSGGNSVSGAITPAITPAVKQARRKKDTITKKVVDGEDKHKAQKQELGDALAAGKSRFKLTVSSSTLRMRFVRSSIL